MPSSSFSSSAASTGASSAGTSAVATLRRRGVAPCEAPSDGLCHCLVTAFDLIFASLPAIMSGIDSHAAMEPSSSQSS